MEGIGEIITGADLKSLQDYNQRSYSQTGYVAPTVYKQAGSMTRWNYYGSLSDAVSKYLFLNKKGGFDVTPKGSVSFTKPGQAETLGINTDFYTYVPSPINKWVSIPYLFLKKFYGKFPVIFKFYKTDGSGPLYAIFDAKLLGASATVISKSSPEKIAALDEFHRQVQLLKYRHNTLVTFLDKLAKKKLSATEQQVYNEGLLMLTNMRSSIQQIRGIEITFSQTGQVAGIGNPAFLIIAIIAIVAAAASWTITEIKRESEKTSRINNANDVMKWVSEKKIAIAKAVAKGEIREADAKEIYKTLDENAASAANTAAASSAASKGLFGEAAELIKWGLFGFLSITLISKMNKTNG